MESRFDSALRYFQSCGDLPVGKPLKHVAKYLPVPVVQLRASRRARTVHEAKQSSEILVFQTNFSVCYPPDRVAQDLSGMVLVQNPRHARLNKIHRFLIARA